MEGGGGTPFPKPTFRPCTLVDILPNICHIYIYIYTYICLEDTEKHANMELFSGPGSVILLPCVHRVSCRGRGYAVYLQKATEGNLEPPGVHAELTV